MRVVVAPDSMKGTLTAIQSAQAMKSGILRACPTAEVTVVPLSDGGEGMLEATHGILSGEVREVSVCGPLGQPVKARYLMLDSRTALVEMAQAAGYALVPDHLRSVETAEAATTFGVGELVIHALESGATEVNLSLGGSATTDGGFGLFTALGGRVLDAAGCALDGVNARNLPFAAKVDLTGIHPLVHRAQFTLLTDVSNPLCGTNGAANVFGPQKGLTQTAIQTRDEALTRFGMHFLTAMGKGADILGTPGSGAAGGVGFPLLVVGRTRVVSGAEWLLERVGFARMVEQSDWVMTGEGCTDAQTAAGKLPMRVAAYAKQFHKPCAIVSGRLAEGAGALYEAGATYMTAASPESASMEEVRCHAAVWVEEAAWRASEEMMRRKPIHL